MMIKLHEVDRITGEIKYVDDVNFSGGKTPLDLIAMLKAIYPKHSFQGNVHTFIKDDKTAIICCIV